MQYSHSPPLHVRSFVLPPEDLTCAYPWCTHSTLLQYMPGYLLTWRPRCGKAFSISSGRSPMCAHSPHQTHMNSTHSSYYIFSLGWEGQGWYHLPVGRHLGYRQNPYLVQLCGQQMGCSLDHNGCCNIDFCVSRCSGHSAPGYTPACTLYRYLQTVLDQGWSGVALSEHEKLVGVIALAARLGATSRPCAVSAGQCAGTAIVD